MTHLRKPMRENSSVGTIRHPQLAATSSPSNSLQSISVSPWTKWEPSIYGVGVEISILSYRKGTATKRYKKRRQKA